MTATATLSTDQRVDDLDLEPIVYKLIHSETKDTNLTLEQADRLVYLYRCYLTLALRYPGMPLVPTKAIDIVWHTHIEDTAKYAEDCQHVFGRPLHHFPYKGMRGAEDRADWQNNFAETKRLFAEDFGIELDGEANPCKDNVGGGMCAECQCDRSVTDQERPRPDRSTSGSPTA